MEIVKQKKCCRMKWFTCIGATSVLTIHGVGAKGANIAQVEEHVPDAA
jgi:hypothetical protein